MTYLITFSCYGTHLHGSEQGSVDRRHNIHGHPGLEPDRGWRIKDRQRMAQTRYLLDLVRAHAVVDAILETCSFRGWNLLAAHARTTHVHTVVEAEAAPEIVMNTLKSYASRRLNISFEESRETRRWLRHGRTRYLWTRDDISSAIRYVVEEQGASFALWVATDF
ncbi:MAG: transposase [Bryobacteraceae bacterium]